MKNRKRIINIAILVLVILLLGWLVLRGDKSAEQQETSQNDPIDIVLDFYDPWLSALRATSTDPYQSGLAEDPILSPNLRVKLADAKSDQSGLDPVLCQQAIESDANISARPVFENDSQAQIMVLSTQEASHNQAVVTLNKLDNGWYIDDIECSAGETAPEREFSFENEGYLLKESVPESLDSQYWHIVFEQRGEAGYTAPLFFDGESMCQTAGEETSVCTPDEFTEASRVLVKGEMTESGVEVKQLELLQ